MTTDFMATKSKTTDFFSSSFLLWFDWDLGSGTTATRTTRYGTDTAIRISIQVSCQTIIQLHNSLQECEPPAGLKTISETRDSVLVANPPLFQVAKQHLCVVVPAVVPH
jgi:hypothetical protein